jgi:hypothetical protein
VRAGGGEDPLDCPPAEFGGVGGMPFEVGSLIHREPIASPRNVVTTIGGPFHERSSEAQFGGRFGDARLGADRFGLGRSRTYGPSGSSALGTPRETALCDSDDGSRDLNGHAHQDRQSVDVRRVDLPCGLRPSNSRRVGMAR